MKKKNILFINGHLNAGGAEKSLVTLLNSLDFDKYNVDLLLLQEKGDYLEEIPEKVHIFLYSTNNAFGRLLPWLTRTISNRDWFSFWFRFDCMISEKVKDNYLSHAGKLFDKLKPEYDVVIGYRPGICTELAAYAFTAKKRISWWHHGEMYLLKQEQERLRKAYQQIDHIVAVSECCAQMLKETFPEIASKITVIPNMIDQTQIMNESDAYLPVEYFTTKLKIITVGRMSIEKNMILCPAIAQELVKHGINFKWIIIGDGDQFDAVRSTVNALHLQDQVILIGKKSNPYPYIKSADIMIHPSKVESQGLSMLEGMLLNTFVIAVKSAGAKEIIHSGENGYLVDSDPKQIAELVQKLMESQESEKNQMKNTAFNTALLYSPENIIEKVNQMIED